jgi:hypothetical protein
VDRLRGIRRLRRLVGIDAPDPLLTAVSEMVVVPSSSLTSSWETSPGLFGLIIS